MNAMRETTKDLDVKPMPSDPLPPRPTPVTPMTKKQKDKHENTKPI